VSLYERTKALQALDAVIAAAEGELTPEAEAALDDATLAWSEKADAVLAKRAEFLATAAALTDESMRLAARATWMAAQAERLTDYLDRMMALRGTDRHEGGRFTAVRALSPWKVSAIHADAPVFREDVEALPEPVRACVRVVPPQPERYEWDKRQMLSLAKEHPDALHGIASVTRDTVLRIK
jgi:hypothetical protein